MVLALTLTGVSAAAQNICDPDWLERASSSEVTAALQVGVDPNQICTWTKDRPLHQALYTDGVAPDVIRALVEGGAPTSCSGTAKETRRSSMRRSDSHGRNVDSRRAAARIVERRRSASLIPFTTCYPSFRR